MTTHTSVPPDTLPRDLVDKVVEFAEKYPQIYAAHYAPLGFYSDEAPIIHFLTDPPYNFNLDEPIAKFMSDLNDQSDFYLEIGHFPIKKEDVKNHPLGPLIYTKT